MKEFWTEVISGAKTLAAAEDEAQTLKAESL